MKRIIGFIALFMLAFAATAFALDLNPLHWLNSGVSGALNGLGSAALTALILWLGKGKWDSVQLKKALWEAKGAVDKYRRATGQTSPGGKNITVNEALEVAGQALTGVLSALRGVNPNWIPHI